MHNEGWYRDDTSVGFSLITFPNQLAAFSYANKLNVRCVFDESSVHDFHASALNTAIDFSWSSVYILFI